MLSNKVADIIYKRLEKAVEGVFPRNIIEADIKIIHDCGLSYSKIKYIKQFANDYENKLYDFASISNMNDDELIAYLKKINGVGQWTAEMIALFTLERENIFSYNDVALRLGILEAHKEFKTLSKKRFMRLKKLYSPYCSYASLYYYAFHDSKIK